MSDEKIAVLLEGKDYNEVRNEAFRKLREEVEKRGIKLGKWAEEKLLFAIEEYTYMKDGRCTVKLVFRPARLRAVKFPSLGDDASDCIFHC